MITCSTGVIFLKLLDEFPDSIKKQCTILISSLQHIANSNILPNDLWPKKYACNASHEHIAKSMLTKRLNSQYCSALYTKKYINVTGQ